MFAGSEGRRAWLVLATLVGLLLVNAGCRSSFGNFFRPLLDHLDTTRAGLSAAFTVESIVFGLAQPFVGRALDRFGPLAVLVPGGLAAGLGLVLMSTAGALWQVYVYFGLFVGVGLAGTSTTVTYPIAARWFRRRRGLALGVLGAAGMAGSFLVVPATMAVLISQGWQSALWTLAALAVIVVVPVGLGLIPRQPQPAAEPAASVPDAKPAVAAAEPLPSLGQLFRNRTFWLLAIPSCSSGFSGTLVQVHFIPLLLDQGYSNQLAANLLGLISGIGMTAVLVGGALAVQVGEKQVLVLLYLIRGIGTLLLVFAGVPVLVYLAVGLIGVSWGGIQPMTGGVTGDAFGRRAMGTVLGWVFAFQNVVGAAAAVLGGAVFDATGSYFTAMTGTGVFLLLGAFLTALLPPAEAGRAR